MKTEQVRLAAFAMVAAIQLAAPISMIVKRETTLTRGTPFRFRTAPVDPYDAFRGRYVSLGFDERSAPLEEGTEFVRHQRAFASIEEAPDGFARFAAVSRDRPRGGPYMKVKIGHVSRRDGKVHLALPLNRYYMNEHAAPAAESAYREFSRRGKRDAYVTVRVLAGFPVIESLNVGGVPIEEHLATEAGKKGD